MPANLLGLPSAALQNRLCVNACQPGGHESRFRVASKYVIKVAFRCRWQYILDILMVAFGVVGAVIGTIDSVTKLVHTFTNY